MRWKTWLAGMAVLGLLTGVAAYAKPQPVTFSDIQDAQERLKAAGFQCTSDSSDGEIVAGFLVSRESQSVEDVCGLRKVGPMGPEWKGKVWVTVSQGSFRVLAIPDEAGVRTWGDVVAFGDDDLLREIDAVIPQRGHSNR